MMIVKGLFFIDSSGFGGSRRSGPSTGVDHLHMGDPVFIVRINGLVQGKSEILVEFQEILLGGDPDSATGEEAVAAPEAFAHQGFPQSSSPDGRVGHHPAKRGFRKPVARINQTQVGHEPTLRVASEEVPRMLIALIGVQRGTVLFYHKNCLSEREQIIQLIP
jgi:hypothetical protein